MEQTEEEARAYYRAWVIWARTGVWPKPEQPVEAKFNPWHDPDNGQFTFAGTGNYFGDGDGAAKPAGEAGRSGAASVTSSRSGGTKPIANTPGSGSGLQHTAGAVGSGQKPRSDGGAGVPYLSSLHNEILSTATNYPPEAGTREWTMADAAAFAIRGGRRDDEIRNEFRRQWVRGYRSAIKAAADRFDLPPELVAGIAYIEVGGDPLEVDSAAYAARADNLLWPLRTKPADQTSFGNMSVQVRRAAESLGYGSSENILDSQKRGIIASLKDPSTSIFIAAKHLSDLRGVAFRGASANDLDAHKIAIIATSYNKGPYPSSPIDRSPSAYGMAVMKNWKLLRAVVNGKSER